MSRGNREKKWGSSPYCPSETEIRKACDEIQSQWTENESQRRAGLPPKTCWMPPIISIDGGTFIEEEAA